MSRSAKETARGGLNRSLALRHTLESHGATPWSDTLGQCLGTVQRGFFLMPGLNGDFVGLLLLRKAREVASILIQYQTGGTANLPTNTIYTLN